MDGFALTQAIRQQEQGSARHLPIIAVTANALQGEAERCLVRGMDAYLSKPLRLPELGAMLLRWHPGAGSAPRSEPPIEPSNEPAHHPQTPEATPALPVFDEQALTRLIGRVPAMQQRLLGKFLVNLQTQRDAVRVARSAQDLAALQMAAHALKAAARSVGCMVLGACCAALESAARGGDWQLCAARVEEFERAAEDAHAAVSRQLPP
jgi:CheY-like chemotaxis protein